MHIKPVLSALIPLVIALAPPAFAESFATSASSAGLSASSAGSASLRGSSDSIGASSDSSRQEPERVTEGDYRVAAVADVAGRTDMVRLTMTPASAGSDPTRGFTLDLPRRALGDLPVFPGDVIRANKRPYGLEFARGVQPEAFFLVLADEWERDLRARKLGD